MSNFPLKLPPEYWQNFSVSIQDINFLHNYLFETESPANSSVLTNAMIKERIRVENETFSFAQKNFGELYKPSESYSPGQKLLFPALDFKKGIVTNLRPGNNPNLPAFSVMEISFDGGDNRFFAAELKEHKLNIVSDDKIDPNSDPVFIFKTFGQELESKLDEALQNDDSLVKIAGNWFSRALLQNINLGQLNLAEAILEMNNGEPITTSLLMDNMEVPNDSNSMLTEFSVNFALQEDGRFDEVGPSGEIQWFLKRLEPEEVQNVPSALKYAPLEYDRSILNEQMLLLESQIDDEFVETEDKSPNGNDQPITLTYPHWRTGSLPITPKVESIFPTAFEAPRIRFVMVDGKTGEKLPAWVVRNGGYIFGLRKWFEKQKLIPGSIIMVKKSKKPGEVIIDARTHRPNRDWVRTVLVGSDGGLVFAVLKQEISCDYNERMVVVVPDVNAIDVAVSQITRTRMPLEKLIRESLKELAKLTPQGHVHVEELYSAVNILRRVPPAPLMAILTSSPAFTHVGDLHYRLSETVREEES